MHRLYDGPTTAAAAAGSVEEEKKRKREKEGGDIHDGHRRGRFLMRGFLYFFGHDRGM